MFPRGCPGIIYPPMSSTIKLMVIYTDAIISKA